MRPVILCILLVCGLAIPASAQQLKQITNSIGMKLLLILPGMHGNITEWCQDGHAGDPLDASTDPHGPNGGTFRVRRGGGWFLDAAYCRAASRAVGRVTGQSGRTSLIGFRVALSPSVK